MKKTFTLLIITISLTITSGMAQDIHFSQFYNTPILMNPAFTGFFDGNYRFAALYRNQWASVTVPYQTINATAELSIPTGMEQANVFGIGLEMNADKAGDASLSTDQVGISLAYNEALNLDKTSYLGVGLLGGFGTTYFDENKLIFDDEQLISGIQTDNIASDNSLFLDGSAGMAYNYMPDKDKNFTLGAAIYHINQPVETFFDNSTTQIDRKFVFYGGATIPLPNNLSLFPRLMYVAQGKNKEINAGTFVRFSFVNSLDNGGVYSLYLGAWYRVNDAAIIVTRFDVGPLSLGFSYDLNVSSLIHASAAQGGPEISIMYTGFYTKDHSKRKLYCPKF